MDRREFLRLLGIGAVTAATPKLIFDMGKNLSRVPSLQDYLDQFRHRTSNITPLMINGELYYRVIVQPSIAYDLMGDSLIEPASTISLYTVKEYQRKFTATGYIG